MDEYRVSVRGNATAYVITVKADTHTYDAKAGLHTLSLNGSLVFVCHKKDLIYLLKEQK